jgi:bacterioferritin-associated ferredoxin
LTRDPIGYNGGVNLYGYVENRPTIRTDPTGLEDIDNLDEVNPCSPCGKCIAEKKDILNKKAKDCYASHLKCMKLIAWFPGGEWLCKQALSICYNSAFRRYGEEVSKCHQDFPS